MAADKDLVKASLLEKANTVLKRFSVLPLYKLVKNWKQPPTAIRGSESWRELMTTLRPFSSKRFEAICLKRFIGKQTAAIARDAPILILRFDLAIWSYDFVLPLQTWKIRRGWTSLLIGWHPAVIILRSSKSRASSSLGSRECVPSSPNVLCIWRAYYPRPLSGGSASARSEVGELNRMKLQNFKTRLSKPKKQSN